MRPDRREAMRVLGALAIAPSLVLGAAPLSARTAKLVTAPQGRRVLERKLVRALPDGKAIIVTRRWQCEFRTGSSGFEVLGQQMGVSVDAPEKLAALAEIEEGRVDAGPFPAQLDQSGRLLDYQPTQSPNAVARAVDEALLMVEKKDDARQRANAASFLRDLQAAGSTLISKAPQDLFFPNPGTHRESRAIELPGGGSGSFELTISAEAEAETGVLKSHKRDIVTRVADSERFSSESWSLTAG
ncbi:hypothetical protein [Qipengyuania sp. DGS5-3]|uniref:hypothetical protein n=1 Tax=Qipengyuania sp. DGS5-3 TaxID=3349632 RepID=UPI0036D2846F